ncbi:MAG: hypothetical protein ACFCU6_11840 [Balneolaceae bacterium]
MKTKTLWKTVLFLALFFTFTLSADKDSNSENAFIISTDNVFASDSCHDPVPGEEGGSTTCELACGEQGTVFCTGMDCGSGTEFCHRTD